MITEDYVSFEIAKLLKEKGFDGECSFAFYKDGTIVGRYDSKFSYNYYDRPTLQMAMKWLREEKGVAVIPVLSSILDYEKFLWDVKIVVAETGSTYSQGWVYEKQEEACEAAIKYCLENLIWI